MPLLPPSSPQEQGQLPQVGLPYLGYEADPWQELPAGLPHTNLPGTPISSPAGCRFVPWQGKGRAGVSVPGHTIAWLSSGSMPQGLASPAHLGHAPKVDLTAAEDARDASEVSW